MASMIFTLLKIDYKTLSQVPPAKSHHLCSTVQPFTASIKKDTIAHSNLVLTLERSFNFHTLANPLYPMELAQIALLLLGVSFGC